MRKLLVCLAVLAVATSAVQAQMLPVQFCPDGYVMVGYDDGSSETIWKISNPSGPSEWFNVDFDLDLASMTIVGIAPAHDDSNAAKISSWARVGIYGDNLTVDTTGTTPDISGAQTYAEIGPHTENAHACAFTPYAIPNLHLGSTTGVHIAFQHTPGDSSMWICSDTNSAPFAGRSYFSSTGYASPATSFSVNWMLRAAIIPTTAAAGVFQVNAVSSTTVEHLETVSFSFYGPAPGPQCQGAMFTAAPLPTGKIGPVLPMGMFGLHPLSTAISLCGVVECNAPVGFPLTFNFFYLDPTDTKPNGSSKIKVSNTVTMWVTANPAGCGFCFGQKDDGGFDGFVFRANQPSGSNDWFSVSHGAPSPASGVAVLTAVEVATWDFCGTAGTGGWAEVGIYPSNLWISPAGNLPDLGNPFATVGGASAPVVPGQADSGYPTLTPYPMLPPVAASSATTYHVGTKWNTGDSCLWIASDSTATGPDPCGTLPNTTSYSSTDGYTASAGAATSINWMQKIDWQ